MPKLIENDKVFGVRKKYYEVGAAIATMLGVVAIIFAFYQYLAQIEASKADRTIALVDLWTGGEVHNAYMKLDDGVSKLMDAMTEQERSDVAKSTDDQRKALRLQLGVKAAADPEVTAALVEVEFFFNRLAVCVEANLCSQAVVRTFFADTLTDLMGSYGQAIKDRRNQGWRTFGVEMEHLATAIVT